MEDREHVTATNEEIFKAEKVIESMLNDDESSTKSQILLDCRGDELKFISMSDAIFMSGYAEWLEADEDRDNDKCYLIEQKYNNDFGLIFEKSFVLSFLDRDTPRTQEIIEFFNNI